MAYTFKFAPFINMIFKKKIYQMKCINYQYYYD